jgi:hypothetical protein
MDVSGPPPGSGSPKRSWSADGRAALPEPLTSQERGGLVEQRRARSLGPAARRPHLSRLSTISACRHNIPSAPRRRPQAAGAAGRLCGRLRKVSDGPPGLYMLNLVVTDMAASLDFYRRLGIAVPQGQDAAGAHVQLRMPGGFSLRTRHRRIVSRTADVRAGDGVAIWHTRRRQP